MGTYLVRLQSNAELVGIFVAPNVTDLALFIDECCDPGACEYVTLPPGSIYLPKAGASRVPMPWPDDDFVPPNWFDGATISEYWSDVFYDDAYAKKWKPV